MAQTDKPLVWLRDRRMSFLLARVAADARVDSSRVDRDQAVA